IERRHFANENSDGPAIADDVMRRHQQNMLLRTQAQQLHTQQWAVLKVEGPSSFSFDAAFSFGVTFGSGQVREVEEWQHAGHWLADDLHWLFFKERKGGTKNFMPSHHFCEGSLEQIHSKRAFQSDSSRNIVTVAIRH